MGIETDVQEIRTNVKGINSRLEDIRQLLTDHRVREVFIESQCDHIIGSTKLQGERLAKISDNMKIYQINRLFNFCPECGSKLR